MESSSPREIPARGQINHGVREGLVSAADWIITQKVFLVLPMVGHGHGSHQRNRVWGIGGLLFGEGHDVTWREGSENLHNKGPRALDSASLLFREGLCSESQPGRCTSACPVAVTSEVTGATQGKRGWLWLLDSESREAVEARGSVAVEACDNCLLHFSTGGDRKWVRIQTTRRPIVAGYIQWGSTLNIPQLPKSAPPPGDQLFRQMSPWGAFHRQAIKGGWLSIALLAGFQGRMYPGNLLRTFIHEFRHDL